MRRILTLIGLLSSFASADQIAISEFGGLNNNDPSVTIGNNNAQDLLNVLITPGGKSVKKRDGYGIYKALGTGQAIHGGYHFHDATGNDIQVWGSSTSLYGINQDGTPLQLISSATLNTTWDCDDTQGFAYCVTSNRDLFLRTNGTTKTWYTSPLGTMVATTPDRVVVAGVSAAPSTLYFSGSGNYTNFTTGLNETDAFTEAIASPGNALTHIRYACQKLLWWKDQSFGAFIGDNQYNAEITIYSDNIGTYDNTSDVDPGGNVWFRGNDGHIYKFDCSSVQKMSRDITPNIQLAGERIGNTWEQSTQSDWQAGVSYPSANFSTTISAGDVVLSSFTATDTSSTTFTQGVGSNITFNAGSIQISTNNTTITNPGMESAFNAFSTQYTSWYNYSVDCSRETANQSVNSCGSTGSRSGSWYFLCTKTPTSNIKVSANACDTGTELTNTDWLFGSGSCSYSQKSLSMTGQSGKCVYLKIYLDSNYEAHSEKFIASGSPITFYTLMGYIGTNNAIFFDDFADGKSSILTGNYTSRNFDVGVTSAVVYAQANWTLNDSVPAFELQTSTATDGVWTSIATSSGTNVTSNRYVRYRSTFTVPAPTNDQDALTTIDDVTIVAKSTGGVYYSQVANKSALTGWGNFMASNQTDGGTLTYYMRSSTNAFTTASSTPSWVAQTNNSLITASTGTYIQVRADFATTYSSATLALNDFVVNFYEGEASDQAYIHFFNDAIFVSVPYGNGQAINNYIFRYDLVNEAWTVYNFGANGAELVDNHLYFGDPNSGNIFEFGTGHSDNGTPITAYWKSKDFTGTDPFNQNEYKQLDTILGRDPNQTATVTYAVDSSTSTTSFNVSLSSTTKPYIIYNKILPAGKIGNLFNVKVGDTSDSSQWELFGIRAVYTPLPYRPTQ
jgi:hypothetical protein